MSFFQSEVVRAEMAEISELQDAGKSKDSALKRTTQKLENTTEDLDKSNQEIEKLKNEFKAKKT